MKLKTLAFCLAAVAAAAAPAAWARNDTDTFKIAPVLDLPDYKTQIGDFKITFGGKPRGAVIGTTESVQAANGFGKKAETACDRALLNVLIRLKKDALNRGGTSVQGLVSMTTGAPFDSATEFQCISGGTNARVRMSGSVVK